VRTGARRLAPAMWSLKRHETGSGPVRLHCRRGNRQRTHRSAARNLPAYHLRVSREMRLTVVLLLNLLLIAGLMIVGLAAHSLGVLAAGGDYLADAAAIGVSLSAIWLSRRPPSPRRPGGYPQATKIAALVNGGWLLVLSVLVIASAIERLAVGAPAVEGLPVLIVSAVAAVVMILGALILRGDVDDNDGEDLNMRAVLLDTAADAAAAGGVAVSGAVILATGGWYWLDPVVALIIATVVGYHALHLVRKVIAALRSASGRAAGLGGRGQSATD
jgi:cobalt-zinc-cadmium efflux system protein